MASLRLEAFGCQKPIVQTATDLKNKDERLDLDPMGCCGWCCKNTDAEGMNLDSLSWRSAENSVP